MFEACKRCAARVTMKTDHQIYCNILQRMLKRNEKQPPCEQDGVTQFIV